MEDDKDIELPENVDELMQIKKDLKQEEEMLLNVITKINEQLHALEVEKMHLSSAATMPSTNRMPTPVTFDSKEMSIPDMKIENVQNQVKLQDDGEANLNADLDLNVSTVYEYYDEEEDEEFDQSDDDNLDEYL